MLAMADRVGRVFGSIPGLASRARVPVDAAEIAIKTFLSPDKYSRTKDFEGRRIEEIKGGWRLINYLDYRNVMDEETVRETKRNYMRRVRSKQKTTEKDDVKSGQSNPQSIQAEAEAEAEEKTSAARS
jgi:hypothetical protein